MSDESQSKQREAHVAQLGEHFDSVQIFCTRHMPAEVDGTVSVTWGSGNWFARFGQVREWAVYEDAKIQEHARPKPE